MVFRSCDNDDNNNNGNGGNVGNNNLINGDWLEQKKMFTLCPSVKSSEVATGGACYLGCFSLSSFFIQFPFSRSSRLASSILASSDPVTYFLTAQAENIRSLFSS